MTYLPNDRVQYKDNSGNIDAFSRLRTSDPFTVFDAKFLLDKQVLLWDEILTGSASVHTGSLSWVGMHVPAVSGSLVVRQTKQKFNYQPGHSQLILMTGILLNETNVHKKLGYFSGDTSGPPYGANNGVFFASDGTTISVNVTLNGVVTSIAQASWNIDKFDGTGPSKITLDPTKTQIFTIDFEWLGVGRVRFGFVIDGQFYYCHQVLNANNLGTVYMRSPNQPIRYEIRSVGGAGSMYQICSTVMAEGGFNPNGMTRSVSTRSAAVTAATVDTAYLLCGIRLGTGSLDETIIPVSVHSICTTADNYRIILTINPVLTGSVSWVPISNDGVEVTSGSAQTITAIPSDYNSIGTIIRTDYISSVGRTESVDIDNSLRIGSKIDGTRDTICFMAIPVAGSTNINIFGGINYRTIV